MILKRLTKRLIFVYEPLSKLSIVSKICLSISLFIMGSFFVVQSLVVFKIIKLSYLIALFGYACVILFALPFAIFVKEFLDIIKSNERELLQEVLKKNTYLEHAAKILRHDMHSGLNTYIPRGLKSLERRLNKENIDSLKLESPLKLLKEGLEHSQQVYRGVFEFTNLVRKDVVMEKKKINIKEALENYLKRTCYADQVILSDNLPDAEINESLFCTAIDNLIRNGLKYNDSLTKFVKIEMINEHTLAIIDNGRGLTSKEFEELCKPYTRKKNQKENGTGLGLNICIAILNEHGFKASAEKLSIGTMIKVDIKND